MLVAVIPAYNEEKNIGPVVRGLFNQADKIVVVDDGSADATALKAREAGAIVLHHKINRGQGAALQTGQDYALSIGADYVLHFDADGQFCAEDVKPALAKLQEEQADILFGSRFLDNRSQIPWFKKYAVLPLARVFNRWFGGLDLTDAHNGFRILNRRALELIRITHDRMAHATEIQTQVKKYGLKYLEFPVKIVYREYGQGIKSGVKIVGDLLVGKFTK